MVNFLFYIIFIAFPISVFSLEITDIKIGTIPIQGQSLQKNHRIACIEFSKTILVKNIEYKNSAIVLPVSVFENRKYSNIRIVTKELHDLILSFFLTGKNAKNTTKDRSNCKIPKFKITQINKLQTPYRIANVEVVFDDSLLVIFGIMKSKYVSEDFWISYPENFKIIDKNYKENFKKQILQEFLKIFKNQ